MQRIGQKFDIREKHLQNRIFSQDFLNFSDMETTNSYNIAVLGDITWALGCLYHVDADVSCLTMFVVQGMAHKGKAFDVYLLALSSLTCVSWRQMMSISPLFTMELMMLRRQTLDISS